VQSVLVDEGDWVKQGQALARLDDTLLQAQIAQAEAELATQKAMAQFRASQLARAESLTQEGAFSKELLEQRRMEAMSSDAGLLASQAAVNEMKQRQARMTLRAPVGGVILQRSLRPGDISGSGGAPYFRIAREGLVELDAELPDAKLSQLKVGDGATVTLPTGERIEGKIRFISPRVDESTGLGRARIEMPYNPSLRAGSYAQASFGASTGEGLTVPASAIRYEAGGPGVMVVDDANRVSRTPVKLGDRIGDFVQVLEGPPAGSRVLAMGSAFTLEGDVITPIEDEAVAAAAPGGGSQSQ
jgi:HlyD family secretion protein